nr:MAG TPA: Terminase small subunit [Caudoviricetes sp.]
MTLTAKQEKFCQGVAKGLTYSDAYREAYDADKMKTETINRKAKELIDNGKVAARIDKLKQRALKRYDLTVDDIISELEEAREIAKETKTSAAMVSASMGKAKLLGLVTDNISARITQAPTIVDDV